MERHRDLTLARLANFAGRVRERIYTDRAPVALEVYSAPGRISYEQAVAGHYVPAKVGDQFGPEWSTHWFRAGVEVPKAWKGREVHLLWDSSSEACVWQDGEPRQGLTGKRPGGGAIRPEYRLTPCARGGERITLYVEMACNHLFGVRTFIDPRRLGLVEQAEIAVFDGEAWGLLWDFVTVAEMARHLPKETPRAGQALWAANETVNLCDLSDRGTWAGARAVAAKFLSERNGPTQHNVSAVGHAHIDTAWLWPLAETVRKCIRTFSTALRLMEDYPEYKFVCSQAQQYEWMKQRQPKLYEQIKARVKEGRFVPAGGTWVEMDCNIPSGESLARQFLFGQRFFRREFGITCRDLWIPDVFGYSAQLPQVMRGAGVRYFLTQKMSWNQFNKLPGHTFVWEGLDGSRVLTHFPPADTYNGVATVEQLLESVRNFQDHERARESYYLFGYGDGGCGPTREMVERLQRARDVDGLPRVAMRSPAEFFERCEADAKDVTKWVGELYFELHRGTYTTQAAVKRNNRKSEMLLRDAEFLSAVAHARGKAEYPSVELERLWKLVLLNQFHDIIPGSSIGAVYEDSAGQYRDVLASGAALRDAAVAALAPGKAGGGRVCVFNTLSHARREVVELPEGAASGQMSAGGRSLAIVGAPPLGCAVCEPSAEAEHPASVSRSRGRIVLENAWVRATFRADGRLGSLFDKRVGREAVQPGAAANNLVLFDDDPSNFEAWDVDVFHLEKRFEVGPAEGMRVIEEGPLRASLEMEYVLGKESRIRQVVSLTAASPRLEFHCEADWRESRRFLKVEFPLNVRSMNAAYEVQYGHVHRPTHFNTSWDLARFEVCAQRWADLSEAGFGVALLNDCKYGHGTQGNVMRLSLLRSPKSPDPNADMGRHAFSYALLPHAGTFQEAGVVREAYAFNAPLLVRATDAKPRDESFLSVDGAGVVVDAVKKAEDSDALIVRLYEAHGGRGRVRLRSALPVASVSRCNLLEEEDVPLGRRKGAVEFDVNPFEIVTLKLHPRA